MPEWDEHFTPTCIRSSYRQTHERQRKPYISSFPRRLKQIKRDAKGFLVLLNN